VKQSVGICEKKGVLGAGYVPKAYQTTCLANSEGCSPITSTRRSDSSRRAGFWANLDLIGGQETWKMFGTGGGAKGQPTQINSISHGSPYIRIRKVLVGAAYA